MNESLLLHSISIVTLHLNLSISQSFNKEAKEQWVLYIDCITTRKKSEPNKCAKMGSQTPLGYFKEQNFDFHKSSYVIL